MVFVAWKHPSRLVQGTPSGDLRLRIVGSSRNGQVIRLSSAKCTVGSAAGCTLRLRAGGVRPIHCVILRGTQGTVVRTWSGHTRLNGQPFADAVLADGDRLAIGPVELEVLPGLQAEHSVLDQASHTEVLGRKQPITPETKVRRRTRQRVRGLVAEVRNLRGQLALLRDSWQESTTEVDQRAAALMERQQQVESRHSELAAQLTELEFARQDFESERRQWQHECQLTRQTLSAEQLAQRSVHGEFELARQNFEQQCELLNSELNAAREELSSRQQQLETQTSEQALVGAQAAQFAQQAEQLAYRQTALEQREGELTRREAAIAAREAELVGRDAELAVGVQELEAQRVTILEREVEVELRARALDDRALAVEQSQDVLDAAATAIELSQAVLADERADFEAQRTAGWHEIERQRLALAVETDLRRQSFEQADDDVRQHQGQQDEAERTAPNSDWPRRNPRWRRVNKPRPSAKPLWRPEPKNLKNAPSPGTGKRWPAPNR